MIQKKLTIDELDDKSSNEEYDVFDEENHER